MSASIVITNRAPAPTDVRDVGTVRIDPEQELAAWNLRVEADDQIPFGALYQERDDAELLRQQQSVVQIDTSQGGLDKAAAGAGQMPKPEAKPDQEQIRTLLSQPDVRGAVDNVVRGLTGSSLDEIHQAIVTGTLPEKFPDLIDTLGNAGEQAARDASAKAGLDAETTGKVVTVTGLLAGMVFPGMGGKGKKLGKAAKAAKAAETGGINLARVDAEASTKATMKAINDLQAARLEGARKTVTHAQTIEEGKALNLTLEQAASLDVDKFDLRATQQALRDFHNAAAKHVDDLMRRAAKGDEEAAVQLNYAFAVAGDLSVRDEMLGKVGARSLEARKILSQGSRASFTPAQLAELADRMGGGLPATRDELVQRGMVLARRLDTLSAEARRDFERAAVREAKAGKTGGLYEAWLNWGLLSGPQTHAANITSNALTALWAPAERELAAVADVLTGGGLTRARSVYFGEGPAMYFGILHGQRDAIKAMGRALRTGSSDFGPDKVEAGADAAKRIMVQSDSTLGHATGFWAAAYRAPTRALTAEDAYFKFVNKRMELFAQAYREASQEGLSGSRFRDRVREIVRDEPAAVKARAEQFALTNTFNREVDELGWVGEASGKMLGGVRAVPYIGRVVAPFMRTPTNLMHFAGERLGFAADTLKADIKAGGALRAEALGKLSGGAMVASVVGWYAASGLITGKGPTDPAEREMWEKQDGRKSYSIRIGDEWYTYNRTDPLGIMIGTVADATDILGRLPEGSPYRLEIAGALSVALARNMVSKTYLQGIADLFEMFEKPDRNILNVAKSLARTTSPSFLRTLERTEVDPARRQTREPRQVYDEAGDRFVDVGIWGEVQELLNEVRAQVPGLSDDLPPVRNRFGEVVMLPPGLGWDIASPIYSSQVTDDPVAKELARLRMGLNLPQPVVFGRQPPSLQMETGREEEYGVELNPREYDRLLVLAGQGGMAPDPEDGLGKYAKLPPFREALADAMSRPAYQQAGDAAKRLVLNKLDLAYKKAARAQLLKESPGLQDLIGAKGRERARAFKGPAPTVGPGLTIQGR